MCSYLSPTPNLPLFEAQQCQSVKYPRSVALLIIIDILPSCLVHQVKMVLSQTHPIH